MSGVFASDGEAYEVGVLVGDVCRWEDEAFF